MPALVADQDGRGTRDKSTAEPPLSRDWALEASRGPQLTRSGQLRSRVFPRIRVRWPPRSRWKKLDGDRDKPGLVLAQFSQQQETNNQFACISRGTVRVYKICENLWESRNRAGVAQWLEHWSCKPGVVSSILTVG